MYIRKKLIMFAVFFTMIISLFPMIGVKGADDVNIISKSEITAVQAKNWAKSRGATDTFANLADLYFKYYSEHGNVNPAVAYVQAAKETNFGDFGGVLDESFHNPCGLKIAAGGSDTDKNAHKRFDTWDEGVQAHLDHLALYAGAAGYPRNSTYDERQFRTIKGTAPTVESLGGKWAPSLTYGDEVNKLYKELIQYSGGSGGSKSTSSSETKTTSTAIGWKNENEKWYYYKSNKVKAVGWINPDSNWFYLNKDGEMETGWIDIDGTKYYLNTISNGTKGAMITGWEKIDGDWYYFNPISDGTRGAMKTGWIKTNGNTYYLNSAGKMVTSTTIDGFKIGPDGKREGSKIIAIDPGHDYGSDEGAVYTINGVTYNETDLNIQVAAKLKDELEKRGYTVVMARNEGERPDYGSLSASLAHRADIANNANADLFISIHHNAVDGIPTAKGIETYYSVHPKDTAYGGDLDLDKIEKSKEIAQEINDKISNEIGANNRGVKSDASAAVGSLFVLRNTKMPGVLIEAGFITNEEEAARCADPNAQQQIAEAIAEAVSENSYFSANVQKGQDEITVPSKEGENETTTPQKGETETTKPNDTIKNTGWNQLSDGSWNYYNAAGTKVVSDWVNIGSYWYYLTANGAMATGWQYVGGNWYYLNPTSDGTKGAMKTSWQYVDGNWYYLNPTSDGTRGAMKTGWQYVDGNWYYLNPTSDGTRGALKTDWQYINGNWYYLNPISGGPLGAMLANTIINGYYLGSDGAMY